MLSSKPITPPNLILGDCRHIMADMPQQTVDLVVTSPPYNLGIGYTSFQDNAPRQDYLDWCREWATQIQRIMTDQASFFLNVAGSPSNPLLPYQIIHTLADGANPLFVLQNTFHWVKSITIRNPKGEHTSAGHFKPINSKRFVNDCHEFVFHLTKSGVVELDRRAAGVPYADKSNITRFQHTGGIDRRCRGNTWFIPYETIRSRENQRPHPATFPVELAAQCIRIHGNPEKTRMLDPFLGIGSSAAAAQQENVGLFTGIEIDAGYLETAKKRINGR
jgi:site-specific DNA-methyltransferase (adenine-specific)